MLSQDETAPAVYFLLSTFKAAAAAAAEQENNRELTVERIGPRPD